MHNQRREQAAEFGIYVRQRQGSGIEFIDIVADCFEKFLHPLHLRAGFVLPEEQQHRVIPLNDFQRTVEEVACGNRFGPHPLHLFHDAHGVGIGRTPQVAAGYGDDDEL